MRCYSCRKYDNCELPWKCSSTMYDCSAYELAQTNEEWLHTMTTEQLAGFIADVCYELVDDIWSNCEDTSCNYRQTEKDYWVRWLKQPHQKE